MDRYFAMVNTLHAAKRKSFIINALKSLVFSSLLGLLFLYNMHRPRIMVVHSYDPTLDIVKDFDNGTKKVLENEIEPVIQIYYMNMLNKSTIRQRITSGYEAKAAINRFRPKILIAVGDEAQEFAAKFYVGKKKMRVLFSGVKGDIQKFGYEPGKNVGAVIEEPQMHELNILINDMFEGKKNIRLAHLGDTSTMVNLTEKILIRHAWKNVSFTDSVKVNSYTDFKEAATMLSKQCDVLLISSYRALKNVENVEDEIVSDEMMKWVVKNTSIPIISTLGYTVEDGAGAAIVSSAYDQGMMAMGSALTMLNNEHFLPNVLSKVFAVFLNEDHISERGVCMPSIYKSFAVGTQKLFNYHKVHGASL
jgi:ABC-type uncharacterized transport system substrate-binding protein